MLDFTTPEKISVHQKNPGGGFHPIARVPSRGMATTP